MRSEVIMTKTISENFLVDIFENLLKIGLL